MSLDIYLIENEPDNAPEDERIVYSANITHNVGPIAYKANIYQYLWRPDENNITDAAELIQPLTDGLKRLESAPDEFRKLNPSNGWGSYDALVRLTKKYLAACKRNPTASVIVCR